MQTTMDRQSVAQPLHRLRYPKIFNKRSGSGRLANDWAKFCME